MRKILILLFTILLLSCSEDSNNNIVAPQTISPIAKEYINSALDIMQNHSINRYKIDWTPFREKAFEFAGRAQETVQTYDAIKYALKNLEDNHSFFIEPNNNLQLTSTVQSHSNFVNNLFKTNTELLGIRITKNIGFLRIPPFSGSTEATIKFAIEIQDLIKEVDTSIVKGWVVDLRQNTGGNMWPMLAGVGPILGNGLAGKFVDPDSNITNWYYEDGKSILGNSTIVQVENYYKLLNPNPYVAVLTDDRTASSGEAMVIAFRGREQTKSFGGETFGVSTANRGFPLSDGAMLILTVSTMADRDGNLYGYKITPDRVIEGEFREDPTIYVYDPVLYESINWLENNM